MSEAMLQLTIRDESTAPPREAHELTLELPEKRITVRELLRRRIEHEVAAYNSRETETFDGLVTPHPAERALNARPMRNIDAEAQIAAAVTAFERTRLLVIVDDRQVEDLDATLDLRPGSDVSFVKLVPLAGG
jgi:hypothetical protein